MADYTRGTLLRSWNQSAALAVALALMCSLSPVRGDEQNTEVFHRSKRAAAMDGVHLRIVTIEQEPYMKYDCGGGAKYCGFLSELIAVLGERLGFSYEFYPVPDGRYGSSDNVTWNGMIGELIKHENASLGADLAASAMTITSSREQVVDFIKPFQHVGFTVLVQKNFLVQNVDTTFPFDFSILSPLTSEVWGLSFLACLVVSLFLWAMNHFNPYEWGGRYDLGLAEEHQKHSFTLAGSVWFVLTTLNWQGFERAPRSIASKVVTFFWFCYVTLLLVTFTGGIVNHLFWASMVQRVNPTSHPIQSLEDLVLNNEWSYGTVRGGPTMRYLTDVAPKIKMEFQMMKNYIQSEEGQKQQVASHAEGLAKARNEKYGYIVEDMVAKFEANKRPCNLTTIGESFGKRSYGLAVHKNSPYLEQLHGGVLQLLEDGTIESLEHRYWEGQSECWNVTTVEKMLTKVHSIFADKPKRVTLSMFAGPLVLLVVGVVLSVLVAIAEVMYYTHKGRYKGSNRPQGQTLKLENDEGNI